jgi:hypothetical protein
MAGEITLGALLGANQSFDAGTLAPWSKVSDQASAYIVSSASAVHSSAFGLHTVAGSTGGALGVVACDLGTPELAGALAFPGFASHSVWNWVWARAADAPSSGQARWRISGDSDGWSGPIAYGAALQRYAAATVASSPAGLLQAGLDRLTASGAGAAFDLDDVLIQIDPLVLHPEWSLEDQSALLQAQHRTESGRLQSVGWGRYRAFTVPLRWLSQTEADVLNWWWAAQAPLAFSLDSSDSAAAWVCRITNPRQPVNRRMSPYADRWSGSVTLESLDDGSLVF